MKTAGLTLLTLLVVGGPIQHATAAAPQPKLTIEVVSSDPSRVTGGDALIEIVSADGERPSIWLNGKDISSELEPAAERGRHLVLIRGLAPGESTFAARTAAGSATLKLTNFPITGPVFAGPKEAPFHCETSAFKLPGGAQLPPPIDANCSIATTVIHVYKRQGEDDFRVLPDPSELPSDVAQTTTTAGKSVPYIVRLETGTIDRGIYQIAVLHDPASDPAPRPTAALSAWNRRMIYTFGGGCGGMYRQGASTAGVLDDQFVGQGYLVMSNSLNVFANNCDDLLAAEAMMMTRERAIELVGRPVFTLGWGCSGGAHQVLQIADNYPGLMDGIVPICNSVDFFRLAQHTTDARLLYDWFGTPAAAALTEEQKAAITGTLLNSSAGAAVFVDASNCPKAVAPEDVFHPVRNPKGVRCSQSDHLVNSLGRNPGTGNAWSILDNVGVQYGLEALQAGKISPAQFLDLNEQIGGYDRNGVRSPHRSEADPRGLEAVYRTGRLLNAGGGLRDIPILELRNYSDRDESATHLKYGTFAFLARLERETGTRANYVSLLESHRNGPYSASRPGGDELSRYALRKMDEWLTAIAADEGAGTRLDKIVRSKPKDLVDSCYDENGERIIERQTFSGGRCNDLYPTYPPPRQVAGGPMSNDVLKCRLKPVNAADYKVAFAPAELARLERIFPNGVCDWSKPGQGQVALAGVWQTF